MQVDLFGNPIEPKPLLRERFIEPPFSVLDTRSGSWQSRKRQWKTLGIQSELGREATTFNMFDWAEKKRVEGELSSNVIPSDTSIFDPALCEVIYAWFCPDGGTILDPFAGGSVRGIVANYLGYKYTGIDIIEKQVLSNREQAEKILEPDNQPRWLIGDSKIALDLLEQEYDLVFSCPPYADLEVYSDLDGDISNMSYSDFKVAYGEIIAKACQKLKVGGFACFVVGEVRDKDGNYIGLVPDTIRAFMDTGMKFYNEGILLNAITTAPIRANGNMKSKKLVKVHQNILIFKKV